MNMNFKLSSAKSWLLCCIVNMLKNRILEKLTANQVRCSIENEINENMHARFRQKNIRDVYV